jgi:hypothetical protein
MELLLTKEAKFDFNVNKYTAIPSEVFKTLVGEPDDSVLSEVQPPKLIMFENKDDYIHNAVLHDIDYDRNFYVSSKGQILCYLKTQSTNESTDTEESKGE